jgi:pyruvate dehydrogenase E2 component (dihydrolipoamide acetyltransferase)
MTELAMPKLSDSMEEGTILTWLKADGEHVEAGDDLVEIETDKATMTYPAEASGTLRIIATEGTSLPVGAPIAELGSAPVPAAVAAPASTPAPPDVAEDVSHAVTSTEPAVAAPPHNGQSPRATKATPLARRVAAAHGISLESVQGSGPLGRVTRTDVLTAAGVAPPWTPSTAPRREPASAPSAPATVAPGNDQADPAKGQVEVRELTRLQAVVARRMAESKATVPHFQVETEVTMDAAVALRSELKRTVARAPSLNDMIVKATALALREHPLANAAYRGGRFELYSRVNIGIAVATEGGLVVPTIVDADQKSLGAIAADAQRLAGRVRDGTITPPELSGATFTVSNLGMFGMTAITPVVNTPQAAILGVGAFRPTLARVDGEIVERQLLTLTLSCDHRILYGADAARFLAQIRELLETPLRLAL